MPAKIILVTGATGYIASRLIPQLLDRGYEVRALARNPLRLRLRNWFSRVNIFQGNVMDSASLTPAFEGVHTAYYLVHNMSSGRGYADLEVQAAQNFAQAAEAAGVKHIIYLGGLADPEQRIAPHMRARIETGVALRKGSVPVTEFRSGIVAGSGSASFEIIRFTTELFPIIIGPAWLKNKAQPIAAQNVIDYLLAALDNWDGRDQVFEIGGPKVASYQDLMESYARARGLKRKFLLFPYIPIHLMAFGIGLTTPVPRSIAYALSGGLAHDSVVVNKNARNVYPINMIDFDSVAKDALAHLHPRNIERVWDGDQRSLNPFKHEGFFIDRRTARTNIPFERVMNVIQNFKAGQFALESKSDSGILFRAPSRTIGEHWLEWNVVCPSENATDITQTSYFAPRGLGGFLYGYLLYPFYVSVFRKILYLAASAAKTGI